ncbi:hypothetical protein CPT_Seuss4 [Caulobacter phage Seuss]|uniref:Uncharacterized protein n=1 Tax=Caulobacter phage Seuss TaxID=1675601 RepID=A0A0K1LN20_9CAUD|nr:hypothetical protein HOR08_gp004 [Caulobacter phage Seuss]AKU43530.1 hypothetical protein CPT_Seuss4 [Caulobacter phage Seuss]
MTSGDLWIARLSGGLRLVLKVISLIFQKFHRGVFRTVDPNVLISITKKGCTPSCWTPLSPLSGLFLVIPARLISG